MLKPGSDVVAGIKITFMSPVKIYSGILNC